MTDSPATLAQRAIDLVSTYGDPDAMADAVAENVRWRVSPAAPPAIMAAGGIDVSASMGSPGTDSALAHTGSPPNASAYA